MNIIASVLLKVSIAYLGGSIISHIAFSCSSLPPVWTATLVFPVCFAFGYYVPSAIVDKFFPKPVK